MREASQNALKGKRVVVTRAAEQSQELVRELQESGAVPVVLPMVAFGPPEHPEVLDTAIRHLREFDWVFFTSQNAVRAVRERCEAMGLELGGKAAGFADSPCATGVKIAAVGPATAEAAEQAGLRVDYVASKHHGTALAEELAERVRGKLVLLPRSDRANADLVQTLERVGAEVVEVCAYRTIRPDESKAEAANKLAELGTDAVLFFSPSAVRHMEELLGAEKFRDLAQRSVFVAIGPVTEQALRKAGVERVLPAQDTTGSAAIKTLATYFADEAGHRLQGNPESSSGAAGMALPAKGETR